MQKIAIAITPQAADSLCRIIDKCLYLALQSPNIASLLDISKSDIERATAALEKLKQRNGAPTAPLQVCTGCGQRSDRKLNSDTALACCPDSRYVDLDDYLVNSVYKRI